MRADGTITLIGYALDEAGIPFAATPVVYGMPPDITLPAFDKPITARTVHVTNAWPEVSTGSWTLAGALIKSVHLFGPYVAPLPVTAYFAPDPYQTSTVEINRELGTNHATTVLESAVSAMPSDYYVDLATDHLPPVLGLQVLPTHPRPQVVFDMGLPRSCAGVLADALVPQVVGVDATLLVLCELLEDETGVAVSETTMWWQLLRMGITLKKEGSSPEFVGVRTARLESCTHGDLHRCSPRPVSSF
jgi:hypothetical protein